MLKIIYPKVIIGKIHCYQTFFHNYVVKRLLKQVRCRYTKFNLSDFLIFEFFLFASIFAKEPTKKNEIMKLPHCITYGVLTENQ